MVTVALATSSFWPRVGGVEEHVLRLARGLQARGHRVVVWAVDRGDATEGVSAVLPGVTVRYLPVPLPHRSLPGVARFAAAAPGAWRHWSRAAAADRPDLVHVHCYGPNGPWATALAAARRLPVVVGTHGETSADASGLFEVSALQRRSLRWSLDRAAAVTACSRFAAADVARFGLEPGRAVIVGNGVDLDEPGTTAPAWLPSRYLLALGRIDVVKGFDLLLKAFARARGAGLVDDDLHLVLAGDGPERAATERLAVELGVADAVVWPGFLDRPTVTTVVGRAEALVVPSRVEAFGIVVLEGMRAGVPVIATDQGGAGEVLTDGVDGLLVDPRDTDRLAAAIGSLADPELRSRLGEEGRRTVTAHTWDAVTDRTLAVYGAVLSPAVPARPAASQGVGDGARP
ncbi:glycosyltransferase family 4 protein [Isoptericola sp. NPDC055881]